MDSGKGKEIMEDTNPEDKHSSLPIIRAWWACSSTCRMDSGQLGSPLTKRWSTTF